MQKHPLFWLPNVLTMARCLMSVFIAGTIVKIVLHQSAMPADIPLPPEAVQAHMDVSMQYRQYWASIGFVVFALAAVTDFLDGHLARKWNAESRFGRLLDPIADKLVVGLPLLAIAWASGWVLPIALPVLVIVMRDALITLLRFVGLGASSMAVSFIAKFKTFLEMILVALFLAAMAMINAFTPLSEALLTIWTYGLWGVAILSAWTGLSYLFRLRVRRAQETLPESS